ncbi:MAG: MFS transporter [candidate division NC10 bacterium]
MTPLVFLFVLSFVMAVDNRIIAPLLPSISDSLAATPGAAGLAMTTYAFAYGAGQLVYGPLSDRFGRVAVVRVAALLFCVCTTLSGLAATLPQFVALRLLTGAFAAASIPLTLAYIGDRFAYGERQTAIGRLAATTSSAQALSASVGGIVAHFVSWRLMFMGYGVLTLLPGLLMFRLDSARPEPPPDAHDAATGFVDLLTDRRAIPVYIAVSVEAFFLWGGFTYLGAFAARRHGLDQLQVGLLLALFGIGTMTGGLLVPRLTRVLSEGALAGSGGLVMGAAFLAHIPRWPWPVFAAAMLMLGFGYMALHTTLQLRGTEINPAARGKAFSLFAFFLFSGVALGTAVLGRLIDAGLEGLLWALCGGGLALVGLYTAWPRRTIRP